MTPTVRDPVALICCEDSFLAWIEAQLSRGVLKFLMTECQVREPAYDRVPQRKHPNLKHLQVFIPYSENRLCQFVVVYSFMCCHISLHRLYFGCYGGLWRTEQSCERMNIAYCYLVMLLRSMKLQGKPMMKHFFI